MKVPLGIFTLGILALALAVCGFSSKFSIEVSQAGDVPSFQLTQRGSLHADDEVEINTFLVVRKNASDQWDYENPMWRFKVEAGRARPLSRVTYGTVPSGFEETTRASNLVVGTSYLVLGLSPGSGGSAEFVSR